MLPYNKRDAETMLPPIEQRMTDGGTITTDSWKAYGVIANHLSLKHNIVNHSKEYVNVDGFHTNNVEGMHKVLKNYARCQFGRLPYLTRKGETKYLDLLVMRANASLMKLPFFT